MNIQFF